jgi:hypothetical protein
MMRLPGHAAYWITLLALVAAFQAVVPILSDEAYFIAWGVHPSLGYYDHPPMPGWLSWLLRAIGDLFGVQTHGALHRLAAMGMGAGSVALVAARAGRGRREAAALALATVPGTVILSDLYLNDTILAFTVLLFVLAAERAYRVGGIAWIVLAALAFDAVLLTKYNGAAVYLGMIAGFLTKADLRRYLLTRFAVISVLALPLFLAHLYWNALHCSINLAFNFSFRTGAITGYGPLWLVLTLLIMAGPPTLILLQVLLMHRVPRRLGFFTRTYFGTLVVLLLISVLRGEFGVNWGSPLGALAVLSMIEFLPASSFRLARRTGLALSLILLVPFLGLIGALRWGLVAPEALTTPDRAVLARLQLDLGDGTLVRAVEAVAPDLPIAAMEYGIGAAFENAGHQDVVVISRSVFGRNQDLMTDFRTLDGSDMVVVANGLAPGDDVAALFDSVETLSVTTSRQTYRVLVGRGFRFESFRETWIKPVLSEFYHQSPFPYLQCDMARYK